MLKEPRSEVERSEVTKLPLAPLLNLSEPLVRLRRPLGWIRSRDESHVDGSLGFEVDRLTSIDTGGSNVGRVAV